MSKHTSEPWGLYLDPETEQIIAICTGDSKRTDIAHPPKNNLLNHNANFRHIISCVNACENINPEIVPRLMELTELTVGFCVNLRQNFDCWGKHQDAGILFSKATTIIKKAKLAPQRTISP